MADLSKENVCCCQMFNITPGVFLIAGHCFLHATYGILLVLTTYYHNKNNTINMTAVGANIGIILAGIFVFGTALYNNYRAARLSAFIFTIVTIFNCAAELCYFAWYINFEANSHLDKTFFWKNERDWVSSGKLPFTIWHVLTFSILIVLVVWWYYSFVLWKYAKILELKKLNNDLPPSERTSLPDKKSLKTTAL